MPLLTDLTLARRLERTEGASNAGFVEARARRKPSSGATWRDFDGTYAMFDFAGSPSTQSFGLGLFAPASDRELDAIEAFFRERGAHAVHEVCPLADAALLAMLPARGYRPVELSMVLYRTLDDAATDTRRPPPDLRVRRVEPDESERYAETAARGWSESPEFATMIREFGMVAAENRLSVAFAAEHDGEMIATGAMTMHDGVALLAGASTVREWRGRGAQTALLAARLTHAAAHGCDLAMMAALPGSTSQLNAERQGFRIAYTRTKWLKG
jgi:GNAT superfamily N-acetyltransferase